MVAGVYQKVCFYRPLQDCAKKGTTVARAQESLHLSKTNPGNFTFTSLVPRSPDK